MSKTWSALLSRPVRLRDGQSLNTLKEAADLTLKNKSTGERNFWQYAAKSLIAAAESGRKTDIAAVTHQLELVLLLAVAIVAPAPAASRLGFSRRAEGAPHDVLADPRVIEAYIGMA